MGHTTKCERRRKKFAEEEINDGVYLSWGWPRCFSRKNDADNMFIKRRIRTHLHTALRFSAPFLLWLPLCRSRSLAYVGQSNLSSYLLCRMLFLTSKLIVLFYGEMRENERKTRKRWKEIERERRRAKRAFSFVNHDGSWCFMCSIHRTIEENIYLFQFRLEWMQ